MSKRITKKDVEGLLSCLDNETGNGNLAVIAFNALLVKGFSVKSIMRMVKKYHVLT